MAQELDDPIFYLAVGSVILLFAIITWLEIRMDKKWDKTIPFYSSKHLTDALQLPEFYFFILACLLVVVIVSSYIDFFALFTELANQKH